MFTPSEGFLLVQRINWFEHPPTGTPAPPREPAVALSHAELLRAYRGIEGQPRSGPVGADAVLTSGVALPEMLEYCRSLDLASVDLLWCKKSQVTNQHGAPAGFEFLGFDLGVLDSEDVFSILFNEVIYGLIPALRSYAKALNSHLLAPSLDEVHSILKTRSQLLLFGGSDLEEFFEEDQLGAIAIWGQPR